MTARVLVIDDILPNVKLLEAKLSNEYFDVLTATSGPEGLQKAESNAPDIILLDAMMPDMDGFEVCRRLKSNPATAHVPVVMVTALSDNADRVRGLEAGADDFLSKPVNDTALLARVRSLVRLKMTIDEWRIRETTAGQLGFNAKDSFLNESTKDAKVLVIDDRSFETQHYIEALKVDTDSVFCVSSSEEAMNLALDVPFDVVIISLDLIAEDGLRLCSQLRSNEKSRSWPLLMVSTDSDMKKIVRGLEIGAHDYILRPIDRNELLVRVRAQVRRKRYQDRLRTNYETSLSLALTDPLTGLFNRRYLMVHLGKMLRKNQDNRKTLCVLAMDIDHFKKINDSWGHAAGDTVLKAFAERVSQRLRGFDLIARQGGEEFIVALPDISRDMAMHVAERLRACIADVPFDIGGLHGPIHVTVSIGGTLIDGSEDSAIDEVLRQADIELYRAKGDGRNRCYFKDLGLISKLNHT